MDTKLKNSKSEKILISTIAILLVVIASIGMIFSYPMIERIAKDNEYNYFESYNFIKSLQAVQYKGYYDNLDLEGEGSKATPYWQLVVGNSNSDTGMSAQDYFNNQVNETPQKLLNVEYFAVDSQSKKSNNNIESEIKVLENGNLDISNLDKDYYQYYMVVNYDNLGRVKIQEISGANGNKLEQYLYSNNSYLFGSNYQLKAITNTNYFIGIPKELKYVDSIYWGIDGAANESYGTAALPFILIGIAFVVLGALLIPYSKGKNIVGFKVISRIPFEIICILVGLNIFLTVASSLFMISECIAVTPGTFIGGIIGNTYLSKTTYYVINLLVWIVIFATYFNAGLILKHIFKVGIKTYFVTSSIIGKILSSIVKYVKRTIDKLSEVNLSQNNNKLILKIVLINAIILSAMSFLWFFGIIAILIYSAIIYVIAIKKIDEISAKYKVLTEATNKIAEGSLEVEIEENLGVFEPLKDDLERIQTGFKKAVDEEVKSQKMKTELISNVSHDLKTPLTSIITYVDLLKDENLDKEKKDQYLDTLDRKAQRLQYLIEDLFEVSKASSGNITLNKEDIDVVSLMKQTLLELEDKINSSALIVKKNFPEDKVILNLDSQRTFRVFENLVLNITKYAMMGSRVYIDILRNEDSVEIILKNMSAEEINFNAEQIVERFVRGDEARNTEGSGLGLAIAKSFVELQGGSLVVEVDGDLFKVVIVFNR